jgi:hypothetical protein
MPSRGPTALAFVVVACGIAWTVQDRATIAQTSTVWSIGSLDDSKAEFSGTVGTFVVGTSPTSAFPSRISG